MNIGDAVEVHSRYEDTWSRGFEIAAVVKGGFAVRRVSDGFVLPAPTGPADLRLVREGPWSRPSRRA